MTIRDDLRNLLGATAHDPSGDKIGKVGQVYYDDDTDQPKWITVHTGLFGTKESFVPLQGAQVKGGVVTVGYDKQKIKNAPASTRTATCPRTRSSSSTGTTASVATTSLPPLTPGRADGCDRPRPPTATATLPATTATTATTATSAAGAVPEAGTPTARPPTRP
jgi:hypothetical protein